MTAVARQPTASSGAGRTNLPITVFRLDNSSIITMTGTATTPLTTTLSDGAGVKASKQPEHDQDNDDQANHAAKARHPETSMREIAAAAAEQQDKHDDNEDEAQGSPMESMPLDVPAVSPQRPKTSIVPTLFLGGQSLPVRGSHRYLTKCAPPSLSAHADGSS
jgi:hypothetical protein